MQTGGHSGTMFATRSVWTLNILHVKCGLFQVFSSWQEHTVAGPCTDLSFPSMLPCWHHVRTKTFLASALLNNVNNTVARSKFTDAAIIVTEASRRPNNGDWPTAVSASQQKYVNRAHTKHSIKWKRESSANNYNIFKWIM